MRMKQTAPMTYKYICILNLLLYINSCRNLFFFKKKHTQSVIQMFSYTRLNNIFVISKVIDVVKILIVITRDKIPQKTLLDTCGI